MDTATATPEQPAETIAAIDDAWTHDSAGSTGAEPEVTTPDAPDVTATPTGEADPIAASPTETVKKRRRDNPTERVKDATAEAARERDRATAAEQRLADAERRLAERQQPAERVETKPAADAFTRPKPDVNDVGSAKYPNYEDYVEDLSDWKAEQRIAGLDVSGKVNAILAQERQMAHVRQRVEATRVAGRAVYPDFDAKIGASTQIFSPQHQQAILATPGSEHVQYALANDPQLAARVAAIDNAFELGLLFAELASSSAVARPDPATTAKLSTAKPPIDRVGGSAQAVTIDPDDLDFGPEYIKAENAREKKRAESRRW